MRILSPMKMMLVLFVLAAARVNAATGADSRHVQQTALGRIEVATIPVAPATRIRSATFTPSGKVLLAYYASEAKNPRDLNIAVMDDDGDNMRTFLSQEIPEREKDNGIRFMVFSDNRRIFMGDFVLECTPNLDRCERTALLPVEYPAQVADGDHIAHRWSEMIIAPDNEHIAWTTLFSDYSAAMFTGKLHRADDHYQIVSPSIISTLQAFRPDPAHPGGVLPNPVRNGEVKQFVHGGTAISLVGAEDSDIADSVVQDLLSDRIQQITHTPGYDETTIFSPDERLGIVMSSRFSDATDLAILGLMPRPYPASLNMGLNMYAYIYSVTGVRKAREGNIGPALIDIQASTTQKDYLGINLNTRDEWVYASPMSWHPDGKKAMWMEVRRGSERADGQIRIQVVHLPDYEPGPPVAARSTPDDIPYAVNDLSALEGFLERAKDTDVRVYGRHSGHIDYTRSATGKIVKRYVDFSDDGERVYSGSESMQMNPGAYSTYIADVKLAGPDPGVMDLKITFGPLQGPLPTRIVFSEDTPGAQPSYGYAEYGGRRMEVEDLVQ